MLFRHYCILSNALHNKFREEITLEKILVLDFGGQYNQLIARRVRENHVYAEIKPYDKITVDEIKNEGYKGVIFTGGPNKCV